MRKSITLFSYNDSFKKVALLILVHFNNLLITLLLPLSMSWFNLCVCMSMFCIVKVTFKYSKV